MKIRDEMFEIISTTEPQAPHPLNIGICSAFGQYSSITSMLGWDSKNKTHYNKTKKLFKILYNDYSLTHHYLPQTRNTRQHYIPHSCDTKLSHCSIPTKLLPKEYYRLPIWK